LRGAGYGTEKKDRSRKSGKEGEKKEPGAIGITKG
jgi:hypothetical protein